MNPDASNPTVVVTHVRAGTGHWTLARNYAVDITSTSHQRVHSHRATSCRKPPQNRACHSSRHTAQASRLHGPSKPLGISCITAAVPAPHDFASPPVPRRPRRRWGAGPQVRSPKCPTCPLVGVSAAASFPRLTCPRQHPFQGRAPGPVSDQLSTDHPGGVPDVAASGFLLPFGCRHSLLGHPVLPDGIPPPLLSAYRRRRAYPRTCHGPWQGFHVSHA